MATRIIVCTHGGLAQGLLDAAGMIAGIPDGVEAVSLKPGMDPFEYRAQIESFLDAAAGEEALLFVDLFGGTPSNMCASLSAREGVEVVAGANLPALIEVMTLKDQKSASELKAIALDAVQASAVDVKERFAQMRAAKKEG